MSFNIERKKLKGRQKQWVFVIVFKIESVSFVSFLFKLYGMSLLVCWSPSLGTLYLRLHSVDCFSKKCKF